MSTSDPASFEEVFSRDGDRLERVKTMPRSVSQLTQYQACPHRYYLARVERVWQRPAAWTGMGTAVHSALEEWERSGRSIGLEGAQAVFRRVYIEEIGKATERTPNFECWSWSGPRYDGRTDTERRFTVGLEHVERLIEFYTTGKGAGASLWYSEEEKPALELHFIADLGGVSVQGYIDRIDVNPDGSLRPVDYKSGAKPGEMIQLRTYAWVIRKDYGAQVKDAAFLMSKNASFKLHSLEGTSDAEVIEQFIKLDEDVKAERFDATPSPEVCGRCDVNFACPFAKFA